MGYYIHQTGGNFVIRADKIEDALNVLLDYDKGRSQTEKALSPAKQLAAVFKAWRWEIEIDEQLGDVTGVSFTGEKLVDDDELFRSIAPFVEPGSFVELMGDDDVSWRWYFDGEEMITRYGAMVFEGDRPKVVIHVWGGVAEVAHCPDSIQVEIIHCDRLVEAA